MTGANPSTKPLLHDGRDGNFLILPGASNPTANLDYLDAALKLAEQVERGEMPRPDAIVLSTGSSAHARGDRGHRPRGRTDGAAWGGDLQREGAGRPARSHAGAALEGQDPAPVEHAVDSTALDRGGRPRADPQAAEVGPRCA